MINKDRIVPVTKTDLLSLYAMILKLTMTAVVVKPLAAEDVVGNFIVNDGDAETMFVLNQPAKTVNFDGVTAVQVAFVADYDFDGFRIGGETVAATGDAVDADGVTLYTAVLLNGAVNVKKVVPPVVSK